MSDHGENEGELEYGEGEQMPGIDGLINPFPGSEGNQNRKLFMTSK